MNLSTTFVRMCYFSNSDDEINSEIVAAVRGKASHQLHYVLSHVEISIRYTTQLYLLTGLKTLQIITSFEMKPSLQKHAFFRALMRGLAIEGMSVRIES